MVLVRAEIFARMRLEQQCASAAAAGASLLHRRGDEGLMAFVDAVEIADGNYAALSLGRNMVVSADDEHVAIPVAEKWVRG